MAYYDSKAELDYVSRKQIGIHLRIHIKKLDSFAVIFTACHLYFATF
jgi:hypothetical protein